MSIELAALDVAIRTVGADQVLATIDAVDKAGVAAAKPVIVAVSAPGAPETIASVQKAAEVLQALGYQARTVARDGIASLVVAQRDLAAATSILSKASIEATARTAEQAAAYLREAASADTAAAATERLATARRFTVGAPPMPPSGGGRRGGGMAPPPVGPYHLGGELPVPEEPLGAPASVVTAAEEQTAALEGETLAVGGLWKGFLELYAAFKIFSGFKDFLQQGTEFNATIESARIGLAAVIESLGELHDASGRALTGEDGFAAGLDVADEQIQKLRVDALRTSSTVQQLVQNYQATVGAGLRAGATLDQIRQLTVGATQAAGALHIPYEQVNLTLIQALNGHARITNRLAAELGLSSQQLKQWKEQGTLVEHLVELFNRFDIVAQHVQGTWHGITSNIRDAYQIIAGSATRDALTTLEHGLNAALHAVLDFKNSGISDSVSGLVKLWSVGLNGAAAMTVSLIDAAVRGAKALSGWIDANAKMVVQTGSDFALIVREVGGLVADIGSFVGELAGAYTQAGLLSTAFGVAGVAVAALRDGFSAIIMLIEGAGAILNSVVLTPIYALLEGIGKLANGVYAGSGDKLIAFAQSMKHYLVDEPANASAEMWKNFELGNTHVAAFEDMWSAAQRRAQHTATLWKQTNADIQKTLASVTGRPGEGWMEGDKGSKNDPAQMTQALVRSIKAALAAKKAALDADLAASTISYEAYYQRLGELQARAIEQEKTAYQKLLGTETDKGDRAKTLGQIAQLDAELTAMRAENARKLDTAERQNAEKLVGYDRQVRQAEGDTFTAQMEHIAVESQAYLDALRRQGVAEADALRMAQVYNRALTERATFQRDETEVSRVLVALQLRREELALRLQRGEISEAAATREFAAAQTAAHEQLVTILHDIDAIATALNAPDLKEAVIKLRFEIDKATGGTTGDVKGEIKQATEQFTSDIKSTITDSVSALFTDLGAGKGWGQGFRDMGKAMLAGLGHAIKDFGIASLHISILLGAVKKAFQSLNPVAMAAASIALIALGSMLEGAAQGAFGGSGGGGGGGSVAVGSALAGGGGMTLYLGGGAPPVPMHPVGALANADVSLPVGPRSSPASGMMQPLRLVAVSGNTFIGRWGPDVQRLMMEEIREAEARGF